jgi:hypothetical protein
MENLPRPPHFLTWDCDHCHAPSDLWDWNPYYPAPEDSYNAPIWCTSCAAELLAPPERRDVLLQSLQRTNRQVRRHVGLPYGTLIICRTEFGNRAEARQLREDLEALHEQLVQGAISRTECREREQELVAAESRKDRDHPRPCGLLYGVVVDSWNNVWPDDQWVEWFDGGVLLFLGGFVLVGRDSRGRDIPAGWLILRSLERPADEPLCLPIPPDFSPTDDERKTWERARGAFFELHERRGRPPGSGRFVTAEDFERAVFAAVTALHKQKRRATQASVGKFLIAKRGRNSPNHGDSPAAPDRQFREWCERFSFDPKSLLDLAITACASGE